MTGAKEALMSMVVTDEGRDWRGEPDLSADLKDAGDGHFHRNPPFMGFPAAAGHGNLLSR
jgi:hypothetical protein